MKKKEKILYQGKSSADCQKVLADAQSVLARVRIDRYTKQSKNSREARNLRKKIAVVQTVMRSKELAHEA